MPVLYLLNIRLASVSLVLLAALCAAGCGDTASDARARTSSDVVRDDYGRTVTVPARPARIVSLNPATTEILFALGAGPRLVGRTHWDQWPDSARRVPDLGDGVHPNLEAVLAAHPDLVILYAAAGDRGAADRLAASGVSAAAFRIDRIDDFRRVTRVLGRLAGDSARAAAVVDSVVRTLDRVRSATASLPRPRVFLHAWDRPLITIGGGSFLSELVAIAGGRNVFDSLGTPSPVVTFEEIVRREPDVVLAGPVARAEVLASPRWRTLAAVREGRVLAYDTNLVARPSVKLGEAAVSLARLLHPGALP